MQEKSLTKINADQYSPFTLQFHGAKTLNIFCVAEMEGIIRFLKFKLW